MGWGRSSRRRADAQWIVATRLLYHVHDPAGRFGRLQRILPRDGVALQAVGAAPAIFRRRAGCRPTGVPGPKAYPCPSTPRGGASPHAGMDSDLEAFSHNPADGSVAALPGRTAAETNYPNQRFLSY